MSAITDMPSVVSGAKRMYFVILISVLLRRNIFGKSGAVVAVTVPGKHMGKPGGILAYAKARKPPGFLF